jgi:hypothetical protein
MSVLKKLSYLSILSVCKVFVFPKLKHAFRKSHFESLKDVQSDVMAVIKKNVNSIFKNV